MHHVALKSETDFEGWRQAARMLSADGVRPDEIDWSVVKETTSLFPGEAGPRGLEFEALPATHSFTVPRTFLKLCNTVVMHRDPERYALLYRLLWRLRTEQELMTIALDVDVARAEAMAAEVTADIRKMKTQVRFTAIATDDGPRDLAWYEPAHRIVEATAPYFARRHTQRCWSILTREVSAHWDSGRLHYGPGAVRTSDDTLADVWRTYYPSVHCAPVPQPLPPVAAVSPRNLQQVGTLPSADEPDEDAMPTRLPRKPVPGVAASEPVKDSKSLEEVRQAAADCKDCPLWAPATQTVFGEGRVQAGIMFVGEQPGDKEDLAGRPFVGPAGMLLDRALGEAGIDRGQVYVTNAVKHFKFEPRGKRRLHKKPADSEIAACHQWLEREILIVQPALIVAMGATAARALRGQTTAIERNRGRLTEFATGTQLLITVHPSFLLRVPEADKPREFKRFVADLKMAAPFADKRQDR